MTRGRMTVLLLAPVVMSGFMRAAIAAQQPASSGSRRATTAVTATTSTVAHLDEVEGSISALDLQSAAPTFRVTASDGTSATFAIDRSLTTVWQNGKAVALTQLTPGAHVKIHLESGAQAATSIELLSAPSVPIATSPAATSTSSASTATPASQDDSSSSGMY